MSKNKPAGRTTSNGASKANTRRESELPLEKSPAGQPLSLAWLLANFSLFAIAIPIVIAAFRILVISKGEPAVIYTLTSTLDVRTTVFGTAVGAMPYYLLWLLLMNLYFRWYQKVPVPSHYRTVLLIISASAAFSALLITPILIVSLYCYIWVPVLLRVYRHLRRRPPGEPQGSPAGYITLLIVGLAGVVISSNSLWLPREIVEVKPADKRVVYVLKVEDGNLLTLESASTTISRIKKDDVVNRQVCRNEQILLLRTLGQLIGSRSKTSICP